MSGVDLTAAIAAAASRIHVHASHDGATEAPDYCGGPSVHQWEDARQAVRAAAPHIEAELLASLADRLPDREARLVTELYGMANGVTR